MKRDQRRAVKIEKELEDHKRQLRRQRAETDASEEQTQSQKLLVNLDPVGAGSNYLLQVAPIASSAEVGIHSAHRQNTKSENDEDQTIEVMLPGH